jgi:hypothetical protein
MNKFDDNDTASTVSIPGLESLTDSQKSPNIEERKQAKRSVPLSLELMGRVLCSIIQASKELKDTEIQHIIQTFSDDSFSYNFFTTDMTQDGCDLLDDPFIYQHIQDVLNDMSGENISDKIIIDLENLSIEAMDKMALFGFLEAYLQERRDLFTLDDINISPDLDDPHWKAIAEHNRKKTAELLMAEIKKDSDYGDYLFEYVRPIPQLSISQYFGELSKIAGADIQYSMKHILMVIKHEDKLALGINHERAYIHGGYN